MKLSAMAKVGLDMLYKKAFYKPKKDYNQGYIDGQQAFIDRQFQNKLYDVNYIALKKYEEIMEEYGLQLKIIDRKKLKIELMTPRETIWGEKLTLALPSYSFTFDIYPKKRYIEKIKWEVNW